jgi:3-phenylpropionate/cinnamic acid dioxygenase small subunit
MSADGGHFGPRSRSLKTFFPIGSYDKTMSTEDGQLGWRSGSLDIILKVDYLRTIHAMFALNWLTGFRGNFF